MASPSNHPGAARHPSLAKEGKSNAHSPSPDPVRAWLAAVIRGAEPGAAPDAAVVLETARTEGVLALCHDRLRRSSAWTSYPETLRTALIRYARQAVAVEMMRAVELRNVLAALAGADLPVLLLKGAALAYTLYPEPYLRDRGDTDLLFPTREDAERASRALEPLGYQRLETMSGDLLSYELWCHKASNRLTHALDLHWRLSNTKLFAERFTFAELVATAASVPALGPQARGLDPAHALLLACMHRVAHMRVGNADRLIWLFDIHLLAQRLTDEQWQGVTTLAVERALGSPCLNGLCSARRWFATTIPEEIERQLRASAARERLDLRQAHRWWYLEWSGFRALPSTAVRLRWLRQCLFPDADYIRHKYGVRHPLALPWFYGLRIVQGIAKRIRQRH